MRKVGKILIVLVISACIFVTVSIFASAEIESKGQLSTISPNPRPVPKLTTISPNPRPVPKLTTISPNPRPVPKLATISPNPRPVPKEN